MTPQTAADTVIQEKIGALLAQLGPVLYQVRAYTQRAEVIQAEIARLEGFAGLGNQIATVARADLAMTATHDDIADPTPLVENPNVVAAKAAESKRKRGRPARKPAEVQVAKKDAPKKAAGKSRGRPRKAPVADTPAPVEAQAAAKTNGAIERSAGSFL